MRTLEQTRAGLAFEHVCAVQQADETARRKYATIVHKLPALLVSAGLCQTLHFVKSRTEAEGRLLDHLAAQLTRVSDRVRTGDDLLARVREAELSEYVRLTDEAMACAAWYRRMVQAVLRLEASDGESD